MRVLLLALLVTACAQPEERSALEEAVAPPRMHLKDECKRIRNGSLYQVDRAGNVRRVC